MKSRSFIGLLIAQFLAAFNDQAIHASAMFFAINQGILNEKQAITLMPILFYAPWALFCTLAGYLADRYSKRHTLVFWKIAEVVICLVAAVGFYLGDTYNWAIGPWLVLACVFLMGTHSAFFVPAKYGVMPEILPPHELSKGNGLLESLSFLAVILGTVCGGILSFLFYNSETYIGLILLSLAIIGAIASFLIHTMPAANPTLAFPAFIYGPLWNSLKTLIRSRPLRLAVIGIAFFTFIVAFMRQAVYMLGESQNPRWDEFKTSVVVGATALGIGLGSPLAGFLSGGKVELGLIPIGAIGMIFATIGTAMVTGFVPGIIVSIVLVGFFTGFYIVPLYTLQQHRAPKTSKGDVIATTNFINVTGAILSSLFFFGLISALERSGVVPEITAEEKTSGRLRQMDLVRGRPVYVEIEAADGSAEVIGTPKPENSSPSDALGFFVDLFRSESTAKVTIEFQRDKDGNEPMIGKPITLDEYEVRGVKHYILRPAGPVMKKPHDYQSLPPYLFLGAGALTFLTLLALITQLPSLPSRAMWFLSPRRPRLAITGIEHIPGDGGVVLLANSTAGVYLPCILSAIDRTTVLRNVQDVPGVLADLAAGRVVLVEVGESPGPLDEQFQAEVSKSTAVPFVPVKIEPAQTPGTLRLRIGED